MSLECRPVPEERRENSEAHENEGDYGRESPRSRHVEEMR
jgi:hypothetical protein